MRESGWYHRTQFHPFTVKKFKCSNSIDSARGWPIAKTKICEGRRRRERATLAVALQKSFRRKLGLNCEHPLCVLRFCNGQTKSRGGRGSSWLSWVQAGDRAFEWDGFWCRGYSRRRGWRRRRGWSRARSGARRWRRAAAPTPARQSPGRWASCPSDSWCSGGRSCRTARVPAYGQML